MTYSDLKSLLETYIHRNDQSNLIAGWITQAEARFNRSLRTPYQEETAYNDMDQEYVSVPADMLSVRAMVRDADGQTMLFLRPIDYRDLLDDDPFITLSPNSESVIPRWTAEDMQFRVYPHPKVSDTMRVRILYFSKIPALSDTNQTNWLLSAHEDIYIAQCLLNAAMTIKADAQQKIEWKQTVDEGLQALNSQRLTMMTARNLRTEIGVRSGFNVVTGW